ncbi:hypothetical protein COU76_02505 [Candidatus Peregrinibacteria bacterium CG10_big_fil_rev_8_21_14_0_10_49_10]|nr:MAG: hypothetical protein COU76_02505 [Candidatus Peregrinibacteria bacterium CG10_big_fil_rev_8_21_14_0_10_49_10]
MKPVSAKLRRIAVIVLLPILLVGCGSPQGDLSGGSYTIGVVLPLTGPGINWSLPYMEGLELALSEVNAQGGVNGRTVRVEAQDGRLEASESATATQFLLTTADPDVVTVVFAIPAMGAGPLLEEAGVPWVYEAYTRDPLLYSNAFKGGFDALRDCETLVQYAKKHSRYGELGLLMSRTPYNEACAESVRRVEPNVKEYWYEFGLRDFRTLLTRAHNEDVDTLVTIGIDFEYVNIFQQIAELGVPLKMICATAAECIFEDVETLASQDVLEGTLAADIIPPDFAKTPFGKKYMQDHPSITMVEFAMSAVGYETGQYLSAAFEQCQPGQYACIKKALEDVQGYSSVLGTNGFTDRMLNLPVYLYEYRGGDWQVIE